MFRILGTRRSKNDSCSGSTRRRGRRDRGATLVEYVLFIGGFAMVATTAVGGMNTGARSYFSQSASRIGAPVNKIVYDANGNRVQQASTTSITAPPATTTTIAPTTTRATTTTTHDDDDHDRADHDPCHDDHDHADHDACHDHHDRCAPSCVRHGWGERHPHAHGSGRSQLHRSGVRQLRHSDVDVSVRQGVVRRLELRDHREHEVRRPELGDDHRQQLDLRRPVLGNGEAPVGDAVILMRGKWLPDFAG